MFATWQTLGLSLFVSITVGTLLVLLGDAYLYLTYRETLTEFCRNNPWAAWLILMLLQAGVMGVAIHFLSPLTPGR